MWNKVVYHCNKNVSWHRRMYVYANDTFVIDFVTLWHVSNEKLGNLYKNLELI